MRFPNDDRAAPLSERAGKFVNADMCGFDRILSVEAPNCADIFSTAVLS